MGREGLAWLGALLLALSFVPPALVWSTQRHLPVAQRQRKGRLALGLMLVILVVASGVLRMALGYPLAPWPCFPAVC